MKEIPFFFEGESGSLFGLLHEPESPAPGRDPFVFCHPFAEEKLWAHRTYVSMARRLAGRGHPVLRFDFHGNGDSDGTFAEFTLSGALADVARAVAELRRRTGCERVALLGLRLGATIAALSAERLPAVGQLVLWAPVVDGNRYMQEQLRINLATQLAVYKAVRQDRAALVAEMRGGATVNVDGYPLAGPLYDEIGAVKLAADQRPFDGRCLVVQLDRQETARPLPELQQLQQRYRDGALVLVREEPFWKEIDAFYGAAPRLFDATCAWLEAAA